MKIRLFFQVATISLALVALLTACTPQQSTVQADAPATLGQIAAYLESAADDYNKVERAELLKGLEGGEETLATHVQALVMVSRAFGPLSAPIGNNARLAPKDADLSTAPDWAKADLENLNTGGVLVNSDLSSVRDSEDVEQSAENETDTITISEVETVVRRVWNLYGTNLKDDFYAAVNKEYMDNSQLPPGETTAGGLIDQRLLVTKQINAIIMEVVNGSGYAPGSWEHKMQDLFHSAADMAERNALGAEPLRPFLERIDAAKTIEEFNDVFTEIQRELAAGGSLNVLLLTDTRDNKKWAIHIQPAVMPNYTAEEYNDLDNKYISSQLKFNKTLLMLGGYSEAEAEDQAGATLILEQMLLPYKPPAEEFSDPNKIYKSASLEELQAMFPSLDVAALVEAYGFKLPNDFILNAPRLLEGYGKLMIDENLELFKADAKLSLLSTFARELSQDFLDAYNEHSMAVTGAAEDIRTPEEVAAKIVKSAMSEYVDRLYVERHFSPEAKEDVEQMIQNFIENYKERIAELDWMSDNTKQEAIAKLDNMRFFVGYPDEWSDDIEGLNSDPSDFFGNQTQVRKLARTQTAAKQFEPNTPKLSLPATTVNAYYNQFNNTMAFPAGILQAPFYDVNASEEENLAGIGTIIAHEMTHAFDNKGAQYDKDGNPSDWWTGEDYQKFQELCDKMVNFYDGWESAAGIPIDGRQTLGENIADVGAMACLLDLLSQKEDADYETFFQAYAKSWLKTSTRENTAFMAQFDEHGPGNLRTNRVISNFQEFFDTFNIQPGDGMYVAPENRVKIW